MPDEVSTPAKRGRKAVNPPAEAEDKTESKKRPRKVKR